MQNYIQKGDTVDWVNGTGSAVVSGQPVFIGNLPGIATGDIANTKTGEVRVVGIFLLAKTTSLVITVGDRVFWNTTTKKVTKTVTDVPLGAAAGSETSNATTVKVRIGDGWQAAALVAALTDSTGGTAGATLASIGAGGSYLQADQVAIKNAIASLAANQAAIITALKNAGLMLGA